MTELKNLTVRLLQVIWVLGIAGFVFFCFVLVFASISGESADDVIELVMVLIGSALTFIFIMLSIQYILFSTYNISDLFSGDLMQ